MCLFVIPPAYVCGADQEVILNDETGIPDKALYHGILKELGKQPDETFTRQEAERIRELEPNPFDLKWGPVKSLKGIGCLQGMLELDLRFQKISSLDGIEELIHLKDLDISCNPVSNLEKLQNLTDLVGLSAVCCRLESLTGLEGMSGLRFLYVGSNNLTDFKPVQNLVNMEILEASNNRITDLKELNGLSSLRKLNVDNNYLKRLTGIENARRMEQLSADGNRITGIQEVSHMKKLRHLSVSSNQIKKLPNLKKLRLITVDLRDNRLSAKEIQKKLPAKFFRKSYQNWGQELAEYQKLNAKVTVTKPKGKKINKKTKTITGRVSVTGGYDVSVGLTSSRYYEDEMTKPEKPVKAASDGTFILKNLKLTDWSGEEFRIDLYLYNPKTEKILKIPSDVRLTVK